MTKCFPLKEGKMKSAAVPHDPSPGHIPSPDFISGLVGWTVIPGKGHATIALSDIPAGTVLEKTPVIVMDTKSITDTPLIDYAFWWGDHTDADMAEECAIVKGGYLALANHSRNPNSTVEQDRANIVMLWRAARDIVAGEEITFDYDCDLWFNPQT